MKKIALTIGCVAFALAACSSSGSKAGPAITTTTAAGSSASTSAPSGGATTTAGGGQTTTAATSSSGGDGTDSCQVTYTGAKSGTIADSSPVFGVDAWLTTPGPAGALAAACTDGTVTLTLAASSQVLATVPEGQATYVIGSGVNDTGNSSTTDQIIAHLQVTGDGLDFTPSPKAPGTLQVTQFDSKAFKATFDFTGVDSKSGGSVTVKGSITKYCVDIPALGNVCK